MADLNGDGRQDLITGCFEGGLYQLDGTLGGGFAPPRAVLDRDGDVLRAGHYWEREGDVGWTDTAKTKFRGEIAVHVDAVDWDADGDLDLLLGTNGGLALVRLNEGSATEPVYAAHSVAVEAAGERLDVGSYSMPIARDWDGDGRFDLLSGSSDGTVTWFRNVGEPGEPEFEAARVLVEPESSDLESLGERTQVDAADFDGDGDLDLLVGDYHKAGEVEDRTFHGWVWLYRRAGAPPAAEDPIVGSR